ncbi:GTPase IMAP family member 4 [Astyanax mexicanus]|uniref:GTPase IMAP family member 4-like n=1 Tax=Astyanax mexicanus TaxID=7994 RepID=A0A8B9K8J7_ASTMX|nr:GTPase IMAP family member 4 [Astyanax mexicanus]KAG9265135.1 GTPase IMAP family member 4-like [Astyanax mexicanus]
MEPEGPPAYDEIGKHFPPEREGLDVPVLILVLLGRRNVGKTVTGNTILGSKKFETGVKTTRTVKKLGWVDGVRVAVVDTPGWSVFGLVSAEQVRGELLRSDMLSSFGRRTFLLVIPVDEFSSRECQAVEENLRILGSDVWKHTMVLFSYGDELRGRSIEEHIKKSGRSLQKILHMCDYRYHVFNNKLTDSYYQVSQLIQTVRKM